MMAELLRDTRTGLREFPWSAALIVLAVVVDGGFNMAILNHPDGDRLQIRVNRQFSTKERVDQHRLNRCSQEPNPGFTIIAGLRQYSMELSVPVAGVRSLLDGARTDVAAGLCGTASVA